MYLRSGLSKKHPDTETHPLKDNSNSSKMGKTAVGGKTTEEKKKKAKEKQPTTQEDGRFAIKKVVFLDPRPAAAEDQDSRQTQKPPPITVPYHSARNNKQEQNLIDEMNQILQVNLKEALKANLSPTAYVTENLTWVGQIHTSYMSTYEKAKQALQQAKIESYTHPTSIDGPKLRKFVLYNLVEVDQDELQNDLLEYGLKPIDIKPMTIKHPRYPGHINYIVYLPPTDKITLNMLHNVKFLCHQTVKWKHYRQPENNVRQCSKCYRFGHLQLTCNMNQTCFLCSSNHPIEECPLMINKLKMKANEIPKEFLCCANCGGQHTAIYQNCPSRLKHITKRQRRPNHQQRNFYNEAPLPTTNIWTGQRTTMQQQNTAPVTSRPTHQNNMMMTTPTTTTLMEPRGKQKKQQINRAREITTIREAVNKPSINVSKAQSLPIINTQVYQKRNTNKLEQPMRITSSNNSESSTLFSEQELLTIFQEVTATMASCNTKQEQLTAMFNLTMKYLQCHS